MEFRLERRAARTAVALVPLGALIYFTSAALLEPYRLGDQYWYHQFYESLYGAKFTDIGRLQRQSISGVEPVYGVVMWAGVNAGLAKDELISFINVLVGAALFVVLRKHRVPAHVIVLLFTNFYFLVILTSAERLKFSFLIMFCAAACSGKTKWLLLFAAPFAHFQTLINYSALASGNLHRIHLRGRAGISSYIPAATLTGLAALAASLGWRQYSDVALEKLGGYTSGGFDPGGALSIVAILVCGLIITANRRRLLFTFLPIIGMATVLGVGMMNMVAFVTMFYILMIERRAGHPLLLPILVYLSVKSYGHVHDIYTFGNGFYREAASIGCPEGYC